MSTTTLLLLFWASLHANIVLTQTPPDFSPKTRNHLNINFNSTFISPPGLEIDILVPLDPPTISLPHLPSAKTTTFLFTIVDPDAPCPNDPTEAQFLHMLLPSIPAPTKADECNGNFILDTTASTPFVPFVNPTPPNDSPAHRYIGLLFAQPADFSIPAAFQGFSAANRTNFDISTFAMEAGLGSPLFANWFLVSNQTTFGGCSA